MLCRWHTSGKGHIIEHTPASRPKVLRIPMGWLALGAWRYCQTSLFPLCNCTFRAWKGFPVGFKPTRQVSSSASLHGRSRTSGGCATWHSHRGSASIYFAMGNWKIVLKDNLSWSGQHGSITPLLFLIPETWTCLLERRHRVALNQSQATYHGNHGRASYHHRAFFALPLIQICGSGCGNCTHRGFLRVVMSHMTLTSSLTRTLKKIANRSSSRPKVKGHHHGMTRITWTHSLYLLSIYNHGTWFYTITGIFALRSSVHTSRTISQFSQKITHSQLSKVKLDLHFMMLYASLDALRITQRIATHQLYHIRSASVKGVCKSFSFFLHIVNRQTTWL